VSPYVPDPSRGGKTRLPRLSLLMIGSDRIPSTNPILCSGQVTLGINVCLRTQLSQQLNGVSSQHFVYSNRSWVSPPRVSSPCRQCPLENPVQTSRILIKQEPRIPGTYKMRNKRGENEWEMGNRSIRGYIIKMRRKITGSKRSTLEVITKTVTQSYILKR